MTLVVIVKEMFYHNQSSLRKLKDSGGILDQKEVLLVLNT